MEVLACQIIGTTTWNNIGKDVFKTLALLILAFPYTQGENKCTEHMQMAWAKFWSPFQENTIWLSLGCFAMTERIQAILVFNSPHTGEALTMLWDCLRMVKYNRFLLQLFIVRSHSGQACLSRLPHCKVWAPGSICSVFLEVSLCSGMEVCFCHSRCQRHDEVQWAKEQPGYLGTLCCLWHFRKWLN